MRLYLSQPHPQILLQQIANFVYLALINDKLEAFSQISLIIVHSNQILDPNLLIFQPSVQVDEGKMLEWEDIRGQCFLFQGVDEFLDQLLGALVKTFFFAIHCLIITAPKIEWQMDLLLTSYLF